MEYFQEHCNMEILGTLKKPGTVPRKPRTPEKTGTPPKKLEHPPPKKKT